MTDTTIAHGSDEPSIQILPITETYILSRPNGDPSLWQLTVKRGGKLEVLERASRLPDIWQKARQLAFLPGSRADLIESPKTLEEVLRPGWSPQYLVCPAGIEGQTLWAGMICGTSLPQFDRWIAEGDRGNLQQELKALATGTKDQDVLVERRFTWSVRARDICPGVERELAEQEDKNRRLREFDEAERKRREADDEDGGEYERAWKQARARRGRG